MNEKSPREFDIVLYGATAFTGKLLLEELLKVSPAEKGEIRLALAARDAKKLAQVARELRAEKLPRIIADALDEAALLELARRSRVVVSTVGPYSKYGALLVKACSISGTHYCDLTGEPLFIQQSIKGCLKQAESTGARIVHCCGYDSIPSDLGTFFLQQEWKKLHGDSATDVVVGAGKTRGSFSGGTVATLLHVIGLAAKDPSLREKMADPYSLNPPDTAGNAAPDQMGVRYSKALKSWTAPFIMAGINTRVVRRSHGLFGCKWGKDFSYSECMALGPGLKGWLGAVSVSCGLLLFLLLLSVPLTRRIVTRFLPHPGDGPDRKAREAGFFNTHVVGTHAKKRLEALVSGDRDPGYGATAIMLAQAALCLSQDEEKLTSKGGILTPATAMGGLLLERLQKAGIRFQLV